MKRQRKAQAVACGTESGCEAVARMRCYFLNATDDDNSDDDDVLFEFFCLVLFEFEESRLN